MSRPACTLFDLDDTLVTTIAASKRLDLAPAQVLFIDDKPANVDAARAIGLHAHRYRDAAGLAAVLRNHDLLEEATHAP